MQAVVLFLNDKPDDPTKRLKLAGVRRYAAAAGWNLVPVGVARSRREALPALLAKYAPAGCICDEDGTPMDVTSRLFGRTHVVFANSYNLDSEDVETRVCVDNAAVARAAFHELSSGNPEAFAVVGDSQPLKWSLARMEAFRAEAVAANVLCHVFREKRWRGHAAAVAALRPFVASLPRHTAVFAVNDPIARRIAEAALAEGLRIPQDLTILGTDNNPDFCESSHPTISSIQLDFERMGYVAASMLAATMKGRAAREMKSAACAANGESSSFAPKAHPSFGGSAATLHCGEAAPSLLPSAAPSLHRPDGAIAIGPMLAVRRESTGGRGRCEPHVLEAVEIIRREACDGLTVAQLAKRLPGSRRLLDLRFREAMGHSVHDEILQVRLERVFDLLRRPEMRIGAIADFSGFALHQLDKVFRARFGCSLRDWRKRNVKP